MRRRDRCGQRARRTASLCSGAFACINAYGIITGYTFTGHIITGYIFTGFIYNFTGFIYNFTGIISITTITTSSATLYCFERPSSLAFYFFSGNHFTGCIVTGIIYITGNSFTGFSIASSTSIMSIKTFDVTISAVPHALWCSSSSFHDKKRQAAASIHPQDARRVRHDVIYINIGSARGTRQPSILSFLCDEPRGESHEETTILNSQFEAADAVICPGSWSRHMEWTRL